jgi:hypothetical protein
VSAGPGVVLFVVAALLLTSAGGLGIIAAPVTLPLLVFVVWRRPSRAFRIAGAFIGGLTAAEMAWAVVYVAAGEARPAIWLAPVMAALLTAVLFLRTGFRRRSRGGVPRPSSAPAGR